MATEKSNQTTLTIPQLKLMHKQESMKLKRMTRAFRRTQRMMQENETVLFTLKEIKGQKSIEALVPLGGGILVSGTLQVTSLKRTIPGNVVLPSKHEEVEADLLERKQILQSETELLQKQIADLRWNIENVRNALHVFRQKRAQDKAKAK